MSTLILQYIVLNSANFRLRHKICRSFLHFKHCLLADSRYIAVNQVARIDKILKKISFCALYPFCGIANILNGMKFIDYRGSEFVVNRAAFEKINAFFNPR